MLLTAVYSVSLMAADCEMDVPICNLGEVSQSVLTEANSETDVVYRLAGVQIVWHDCDEFPHSFAQASTPWFIIRLRNDKPPRTVSLASLDVMGQAFVEDRGGYMADPYYQAVQATAQLYNGDPGVLPGFVIAHELGHLLLGPGQTLDGVMQAAWGQKQMDALSQRWLKFSNGSSQRIRRALEARVASAIGKPGLITLLLPVYGQGDPLDNLVAQGRELQAQGRFAQAEATYRAALQLAEQRTGEPLMTAGGLKGLAAEKMRVGPGDAK
jgi:hypothetical protein